MHWITSDLYQNANSINTVELLFMNLSIILFFFPDFNFFSRIKWILSGGIWICLKAIIITKCKRTPLRALLFDDFLLFGLQNIWESLKTLAILFFLCDPMFCVFLFQSVRCDYFCLRASLRTQVSIYFLLKPSCPSQWQRRSDPQMMRETASCRDWKWIGSISSDSWHFQKYIYKTKYLWLIKNKNIPIAQEGNTWKKRFFSKATSIFSLSNQLGVLPETSPGMHGFISMYVWEVISSHWFKPVFVSYCCCN